MMAMLRMLSIKIDKRKRRQTLGQPSQGVNQFFQFFFGQVLRALEMFLLLLPRRSLKFKPVRSTFLPLVVFMPATLNEKCRPHAPDSEQLSTEHNPLATDAMDSKCRRLRFRKCRHSARDQSAPSSQGSEWVGRKRSFMSYGFDLFGHFSGMPRASSFLRMSS